MNDGCADCPDPASESFETPRDRAYTNGDPSLDETRKRLIVLLAELTDKIGLHARQVSTAAERVAGLVEDTASVFPELGEEFALEIRRAAAVVEVMEKAQNLYPE